MNRFWGIAVGVVLLLLASTNVSLPLSNWGAVGTDFFDSGGHFRFTNTLDPGQPRRFYILQLP